MPDPYKPSEFGGKTQANGLQPVVGPDGVPGHEPTASEKLSLVYRTGSENGDATVSADGEAFEGVLPLAEQVKLRKDEGALPRDAKESDVVWTPGHRP